VTGDNLDVSLVDEELLDEVELTANLIVAAADSDGPLPLDVLDRLLLADEADGTKAARLPPRTARHGGRPTHTGSERTGA
jgi:hypothetical protein